MGATHICYFGDYDPEYIRNDVIISALQENDIDIVLCNVSPSRLKRFFLLFQKYTRLPRRPDMIIVGSSDTSRWLVVFAKILSFGRFHIVWDAHYSIYDAYVNDRKLVGPTSIKARYYFLMEQVACALSHKILLDTNEHIRYFSETFGVDKKKFIRVLVGSTIKKYDSGDPIPHEPGFLVSFHGKYIPLQGVPYIIRAAKILERYPDIHFNLIGNGQTYKEARALASELDVKNITFIERVPLRAIPSYLLRAHVSLGIFGEGEKTLRVIANKIYEAIELGVPVITADTPGIRELFTDREDILLCHVADADDLAQKILLLRNDPALLRRVGEGGRGLFERRATPKIIGKQLLEDLGLPLATS